MRFSGAAFEAVSALAQRRQRCQLYHSAIVVTVPSRRVIIEMTPIPDRRGDERGVVGEGAVGSKRLGRWRVFRYEIRRWEDGQIPDADATVSTITRRIDDNDAERLLELVASVPTPVWGRDELGAGEMWNSNSITAWILSRGGIDTATMGPPPGGRAPGWGAGLTIAERQ